jgi:uncharacterized membrane protein
MMKQILTDTQRIELDQLIKETEERTKTQIVLAVVKRCDHYPEIPWKAFAFSASLAGLLVFLYHILFPGWITNGMILISMAVPMAAGVFFSLLTIGIPGFARLFLADSRVETETRQYAESVFRHRELFATAGRTGILFLVCIFEKHIVILPDKGLHQRLPAPVLMNIIRQMSPPLRHKDFNQALETGLHELIRAMESSAPEGPVVDELSNQILEEKGA